MFKRFETQLAGRPLVVETGKMAQLAGGSCLVRYGETEVLCNATMAAKPREGIDFFPLSVDYEEKLYAVGKIPGSFQRREGRPSDKAILASRLIDRPIRPLFPKEMRNDVGVVATVMSVDPECAPEITAMIGVSIAIEISEIPWTGPIGGVHVGLIDGQFVINPTRDQEKESEMLVTVASTSEKVTMLEAAANEVSEEDMLEGIMAGHAANQEIIAFIKEIAAEVGKEKQAFVAPDHSEVYEKVRNFALEDVKAALDTDDKRIRDERLAPIFAAVHEKFDEEYEGQTSLLDDMMDKLQKEIVRTWILREGKRVDGRGIDDIRPLTSEIDLISRVHGSGMFTRGQTQVLTITTLGPVANAQMLDGIDDVDKKVYMHQYNFPSYSVGETRPSRGPGRREIGHGALAEKALIPVIPSIEEFPYSYRLVSEVLSSNGSTSQAAICASTLSLMAAGVPIKAPVAGISCGLITSDNDDDFITMVDIQGLEDFYGDMDFKVGGTEKGITAIQMDLKNDGLTRDMIKEALERTRKGRLFVLEESMLKAIAEPKAELSKYAPKMLSTKINPDKIGDVIGKQGKVIQKISEECESEINIEEDGTVFVSAIDLEKAQRAIMMVETIANDPEAGAIFKGVVTRLMPFGAFVEIAPGKEGLVHISQLDVKRTEKVEDAVNIGDSVIVKVLEVDEQGRLNLSRREALIEVEGLTPENEVKPRSNNRPPRRNNYRK